MQRRAVRVSVNDMAVLFDREPAVLVDLSRSGARVLLPEPRPVDTAATLRFRLELTSAAVPCRVVRCQMDPLSVGSATPEYLVSVHFDLPEEQVQTTLHRVLEAHRRRTAARTRPLPSA